MLRSHQRRIQEICQRIASGASYCHQIIANVTPGGGKSALPIIAAHELLGTRQFQKVCWVVPRESLQRQAEEQFLDKWLRKLLDHELQIRIATNEVDPCRGLAGYVTTYQAIGVDSAGINLAEFKKHRYLLVLDECQHVENGSQWHQALAPLASEAKCIMLMSGTLDRGNGKKIAFLPYEEFKDGEAVCLEEDESTAVVEYSLEDALAEEAVIRLYFTHLDFTAEYLDRSGVEQFVQSGAASGERSNDALFTALRTGFAFNLLDVATKEWGDRKSINPRAKLLVVAADIKTAKRYVEHLRTSGLNSGIATSEDAEDAKEQIKRFKSHGAGKLDILVTVAMAYEGLDVPSITHIACLTHIRSRPWIEQMLARATRFDKGAGSWGEQTAVVIAPDDPMMRAIKDEIDERQRTVVRERESKKDKTTSLSDVSEQTAGWTVPLGSTATVESYSELGSKQVMAHEEATVISRAMQEWGICGVTPLQFKKAAAQCGFAQTAPVTGSVNEDTPLTPASEKEANLRESIKRHVARYEKQNDLEHGTLNKWLIRRFRKSRPDMTFGELSAVWAHLQREYPIDD